MRASKTTVIVWNAMYFSVLLWSAIRPKDYLTWLLEVFPALIGYVILFVSYRRFTLTNLSYILILIHCCILFVGGHYTYAEVPFFNYVRDLLHQSRNNYDKIGHFAQGFVPAIVAREILIRLQVVRGRGWLFFIVTCICLAVSAMYELVEWFTSVVVGGAAEAFLGTQGYIWDTQSDMLLALVGALCAQIILGSYHDAEIRELELAQKR